MILMPAADYYVSSISRICHRIVRLIRIYRTENLHLTHYSSAHFRDKQQKALESFLSGLQQEDKTGTFPDRGV